MKMANKQHDLSQVRFSFVSFRREFYENFGFQTINVYIIAFQWKVLNIGLFFVFAHPMQRLLKCLKAFPGMAGF